MKKNKDEIVIYTNETCSTCKITKETLEKNKIKFTEKLISRNQSNWNKIMGLTGLSVVPTVIFKDTYFIPGRDYPNPEFLVGILKNYNGVDFPKDQMLLERFKTINYNMANAFKGLEKVLENINNKLKEKENEEKS
tara:strand:- start:93 stop:500 length:408 start_codon:yes stop_codon:yes gene_type:complete